MAPVCSQFEYGSKEAYYVTYVVRNKLITSWGCHSQELTNGFKRCFYLPNV